MAAISLKVEFSGGLELLFSNERKHSVNVPSIHGGQPTDLAYLILYLRDTLLKERAELFVENDTVYVP